MPPGMINNRSRNSDDPATSLFFYLYGKINFFSSILSATQGTITNLFGTLATLTGLTTTNSTSTGDGWGAVLSERSATMGVFRRALKPRPPR